jgi:hypothetical protein
MVAAPTIDGTLTWKMKLDMGTEVLFVKVKRHDTRLSCCSSDGRDRPAERADSGPM